MTNDRSGDFDARRVGWWQRRAAVRSLRRAAGITPADRDLRIQSARVAQTRGELNVLTRGLTTQAPAAAPHVPYPPAAYGDLQQRARQQPTNPPPTTAPPVNQRPAAAKRSVGRSLAIALVVVVLLCGGSVVSCVSSIVDTVSSAGDAATDSGPAAPTDLQTVEGWSQMMRDLRGQVRAGQATRVVVRRSAATIATVDPGDAGQELHFIYDGEVTPSTPAQRTPGEELFDLTAIAPGVVPGAVALARSRSGATSSSESWVTILDVGAGPRISVSFPDGTVGGYELVVDVDGTEISQTP